MDWQDVGIREVLSVIGSSIVFYYRKAIGRFMKSLIDKDGDGRIDWTTELLPIGYFLLTCYMVYQEGKVLGQVYSDTWIIFISLGALGVKAVSAVLKYQNAKLNTRPSQDLPDEP